MIPKVAASPDDCPDREQNNYGWLATQAELARRGEAGRLDLAGIAAEFEELMGDKEQQLENRLIVLYQHLLKYQFQPSRRTTSWASTIIEQRHRLRRMLDRNPGMKAAVREALANEDLYLDGRDEALTEFFGAGVPIDLPETNPYSPDQILDPQYWPGPGPHPVLSDRQRARLRLPTTP